jgi:hypothetical protein
MKLIDNNIIYEPAKSSPNSQGTHPKATTPRVQEDT